MILFFEKCLSHIIPRIKAAHNNKKDNFATLRGFVEKLEKCKSDVQKSKILNMIAEYFNVALWIKDTNNIFIYVNEACCKLILFHPIDDALFKKDGEFEQNALSVLCTKSDAKVIEKNTPLRFIEHAIYNGGKSVWIDVCKSPTHSPNNRIIGTIGSGVDISKIVPQDVKDKYREAQSVEISFDVMLTKETIIKILEVYKNK